MLNKDNLIFLLVGWWPRFWEAGTPRCSQFLLAFLWWFLLAETFLKEQINFRWTIHKFLNGRGNHPVPCLFLGHRYIHGVQGKNNAYLNKVQYSFIDALNLNLIQIVVCVVFALYSSINTFSFFPFLAIFCPRKMLKISKIP